MRDFYIVPLGADFIKELTGYLTSMPTAWEKTAVVFPGKRPSLYLKKALAEGRSGPFFPPRIFSMDEFIEYVLSRTHPGVSDLPFADAVWLLWKAVGSVEAMGDHPLSTKSFGEFYPWGQHLLSFINQLDAEAVPDEKLKAVESNARIGYDVPETVNELLKGLVAVRQAFHNSLEREKAYTRGYRYLGASRAIGEADLPDLELVVFAGIFAVTTTERELIRTLWTRGMADVIVECERDAPGPLGRLLAQLGGTPQALGGVSPAGAEVFVYSGIDRHAEVVKAAGIVTPLEGSRTAIVLPDPATLFPLLTFAVDGYGGPYNVSLGYPLERTSVFEVVSSIVTAQRNRRARFTYATRDYLGLLFHPFVKNLRIAPGMNRLASAIERALSGGDREGPLAGRPFIALEEVEHYALDREARIGGAKEHKREQPLDHIGELPAADALKRVHDTFFRPFETVSTVKEFCECIAEALEFVLRNTPVRSYVLSGEIFARLYENLDELKAARFASERFHENAEENMRTICDFVLRHLSSASLPFETTPVENLEILGVLETRNLRFDRVIMLDVNEGVMPGTADVDPLIPIGIYESLGIPTAKESEEVSRFYFQRLLRSAREVHLLYVEGDGIPRSRYIEQIIWEREQKEGRLGAVAVERSFHRINLKPKSAPLAIPKSPALIAHLLKTGYSPSSLDDYLQCPILFFFRRVMGFEEKKAVSRDIDNLERGTLVHRILFDTFRGYVGREVSPQDLSDCLGRLERAIRNSFDGRVVTGEYYLFKRLVEHKLTAFVSRNLGDAGAPFIVHALEKPLQASIDAGGQKLALKGRADRIDKSPATGEYTIIDYKTGAAAVYPKRLMDHVSPSSMADIHEHITSLQLPLYIYLFCESEGVAAGDVEAKFALLRNNAEAFLLQGGSKSERESFMTFYTDVIRTVLGELIDPSKLFAPFDDEACPGCPYRGMCHG